MANIFVYDEFTPEDVAMMQALYSRSAQSVETHVDKVRETGSGKFMERFYVGYGHKSIADCGSTTIFIEGVSMLVAKAIQDWPLYSGQETSSRYIDYTEQPVVDPVGTPESKAILDKWMDFYISNQEAVREHLGKLYPMGEGEKEGMYKRALAAWAYDVMRGFLPVGVTTQLSWHTNLRQAWDKVYWLLHHPLQEVRDIAQIILEKLQDKYAHSFGFEVRDEETAYVKNIMKTETYYDPLDELPGGFHFDTTVKNEELEKYEDIIAHRPKYAPLPLFLGELGQVSFELVMDFGSFRDIQRHRNGVCRMPLLNDRYGFNEWYISQLPENLQEQANTLIIEQHKAIAHLDASPEDKQYYYAMGINCRTKVTYPINAGVYVTELRAGRTVHPTLRIVAHKMHHALTEKFPKLKLYSDLSADDRDIRRGKQDIQEKPHS